MRSMHYAGTYYHAYLPGCVWITYENNGYLVDEHDWILCEYRYVYPICSSDKPSHIGYRYFSKGRWRKQPLSDIVEFMNMVEDHIRVMDSAHRIPELTKRYIEITDEEVIG